MSQAIGEIQAVFQQLEEEINRLDIEIKQLEEKKAKLIKEVQEECPHINTTRNCSAIDENVMEYTTRCKDCDKELKKDFKNRWATGD